MIRARSLALAAALGLAAAAAPAFACSVVDDYRVPTNLELARDAELILLARVTGEQPGEEEYETAIAIEPIAALKGDLPPGPLALGGRMRLAEGEAAGYGVLSNPYEFEGAHPLSYIGGCIRYIFPRGATALFFLEEVDHRWIPSGGPFSRWAEDVPGPDAPWAALVRLYVRAAALPESEARALLETERDRLRERGEDPVNRLMADDIERQLAGPNETWNALMERQLGFGGAAEEAAAEAMAAAALEIAGLDGEDGEEWVEDEAPPESGQAEALDDPRTVQASCEPGEAEVEEAGQVATVRKFFELGDSGRFAEIGPLLLPGALAYDGGGDTMELAAALSDSAATLRAGEHTDVLGVLGEAGLVAVKVAGNSGSEDPVVLNFSFEGRCIAGMYFL